MTEFLTIPLGFEVMQRAALMAAIVTVPAALLSCFVVLKGWSLMGDAISHAVLPGIVLAWLTGLPLVIGALAAGLGCGSLSSYMRARTPLKPDAVLGVVMSAMFALGLFLHTKIETGLHIDHILFGNILRVQTRDLWVSGLIGAAVAVAVLIWRRDLTLFAFDPVQAQIMGLDLRLFQNALMAGIVLVVVATLSSVGLILAVSVLIAPGATAFLLTRRMGAMLAVASGLALFAGQAGLIASFWLDAAPAPTIVLILTAEFIAAFIWRARRASLDLRPPHA
ncbi:MAG: metal ABC transporter permease [Paracoccus sp. (in: a-proteobacteria)]|nr:metal ABC transporter permease [Paracoccus sp. (in: a-proteobacteria)]